MKQIKKILFVFVIILSFTKCDSLTNQKEMKTNDQTTATKEIIVDVRTPKEWKEDGHSDCSVNIPMDQFESKIEELKKYDKVIIVCRSGNRAGIAKKKLIDAGYKKEVENLGAWQNITCSN